MIRILAERFLRFFAQRGLFLKLRNNAPKGSVLRRLISSSLPIEKLSSQESVLVVGVGPASLAFLEALKQAGYRKVQVLCANGDFGGKCVNRGCMPFEFAAVRRSNREGVLRFVSQLKALTQQRFESLGFPLISRRIVEVLPGQARLDDGTEVAFNRLVLATGRYVPRRDGWACGTTDEFWQFDGSKLSIVSDGQPMALSYAALAADMGISVAVVFTKKCLLGHLPSFQYFERMLRKKGIKIFHDPQIGVEADGIRFLEEDEHGFVPWSEILVCDQTLPLFPKSSPKATWDRYDFSSGRFSDLPGVYAIGDAAGLLSASEAELHGRLLAQSWMTGRPVSVGDLEVLPFALHGAPGLGMVGSRSSWIARSWRNLDFKTLGVSLIQGDEGQVWYLLDEKQNKVEAFHVCHPRAAELASQAAALLPLPLSHPLWQSAGTHPSAFEIFRILAHRHSAPALGATQEALETKVYDLRLPMLKGLDSDPFFVREFSSRERCRGLLASDPKTYFGLSLAIKAIHQNSKLELKKTGDGEWICPELGVFHYEADEHSLRAYFPDYRARAMVQFDAAPV